MLNFRSADTRYIDCAISRNSLCQTKEDMT